MSGVRERIDAFGWRRLAMTVVILAVLGFFFGVMEFWRNQVFLVTAWVGGVGLFPEDFYLIGHRLHEVAFALLFWPFIVGLLAQFRKPTAKIAAQLMALMVFVGVLIAMALTGFTRPIVAVAILGGPTLLATLLHPAGRDLLRSIDGSRVNRVTLALVIVAAVPLLAFAATQVGLQTGAIEPAHDHGGDGAAHEEVHEQHVKFGHFNNMAAFVFVVLGVGLLASLQQPGWWLPAWLAGLMPVVFGLAALAAPEASSNPGMAWAVAAILWGLMFIAAAEYTQSDGTPSPLGGRASPASD